MRRWHCSSIPRGACAHGFLFGLVQVLALDFSPPWNIHCDTGFIIVLRLIAVRVVYLV